MSVQTEKSAKILLKFVPQTIEEADVVIFFEQELDKDCIEQLVPLPLKPSKAGITTMARNILVGFKSVEFGLSIISFF
jgi:hypothetical protein